MEFTVEISDEDLNVPQIIDFFQMEDEEFFNPNLKTIVKDFLEEHVKEIVPNILREQQLMHY